MRAAAELLVQEHPAVIAMPAIARRAGVSLATLYRYFPNKEALFDAITALIDGRSRAWVQRQGLSIKTAPVYLTALWTELAAELPLLRAQHDSPGGRAIRRQRREARTRAIAAALSNAGIALETEAGQRLLALTALLGGSAALLELHDFRELPPATAAQYAAWAMQTLVAHTLAEQREATKEKQP